MVPKNTWNIVCVGRGGGIVLCVLGIVDSMNQRSKVIMNKNIYLDKFWLISKDLC